jgi:hypothetical protein
MERRRFVSVLIVNQAIESKGILANVALVLGLTAGRELPQSTFGSDVLDGEGAIHRYLTNIGHVVRKAGHNKMRTIRTALVKSPDVLLVHYTEDAAPVDYNSYSRSLVGHSGEDIKYRAIYIYGPGESVMPLTKNLSRLE